MITTVVKIGKGNGAFIGGYMIGAIQTRLSFRYLGIAAGVFGVFFYLLHLFWLDAIVHKRIDKHEGYTLKIIWSFFHYVFRKVCFKIKILFPGLK